VLRETNASCLPSREYVAGPTFFLSSFGGLVFGRTVCRYSANRWQGTPSPHSLSPGSGAAAPMNVSCESSGASATVFSPQTASIVAPKYFSAWPLPVSIFTRSPSDGIRRPLELHVGRPEGGAFANRRW